MNRHVKKFAVIRYMVIIGAFLSSFLPLWAADTNALLFTYHGTNVTTTTIMGISREAFVERVKPLLSWNAKDALATEIRFNFNAKDVPLDPTNVENAIAQFYDDTVRQRLKSFVAELVVDETGVQGFHYSTANVSNVIEKRIQNDKEWRECFSRFQTLTNTNDIGPIFQQLEQKWEAQYSWYKTNGDRTELYKDLLGTKASRIYLDIKQLLEIPGWTSREGNERAAKLANFAYETRFKIHPRVATNYIEEYAGGVLKYNVFVAQLDRAENAPKVAQFLATLVGQDGYVATSGLQDLNERMNSLGGTTRVAYRPQTKKQFSEFFGQNMDAGRTNQGQITNATAKQLPRLFLAKWPGTNEPLYFCYVFGTIKGSDAQVRDPRVADPTRGAFSNFISQKYLDEKVAATFRNLLNQNSYYLPTPTVVRQVIEGSSMSMLSSGWAPEELQPID